MPLILLGLGSAFIGAKVDSWLGGLMGTNDTSKTGTQWTPVKVAFVGSAAVFVALGVKKILD